jgi:putative ABC transport system substrate-binding protein
MKRGLAAVLLTLCLAGTAAAQQAGRVYRVALLAPGEASVANTRQYTLPVLERAGFVEGRNLVLEVRETGGSSERSAAAAAELAAWRPDAVIAVANGAVAAVRRAMPTTPVLMAFSDDPVGQGFVQSLARPGGWATGVALQSTEANRKRLELARELMPSAKASSARVGIVLPRTYTKLQRADLRRAATDLDVEVVFAEATAPSDYAAAFAALRAAGVGVATAVSNGVYAASASGLAREARAARIALVCEWREMALAGCAAAFGPTQQELRSRVGEQLVRVLRGEPPGQVPVEQPARFELVLNRSADRTIGYDLPRAVLLRADEVIE